MGRRKSVVKVEVGTVFTIEVCENRLAFGQVVTEGKPKLIAVFDFFTDITPPIEVLIEKKILFLTHVVDNAIAEGRWISIGNTKVTNFVLPNYKVETNDGCMVTDHSGRILRVATIEEERTLKFRDSVTPAVIESALKARIGILEWTKYYDRILYATK